MRFSHESSDEELMKAYQSGDSAAFDLLFERYKGRVFGFLMKKLGRRFDAEEVFQATFMKLHQSRRLYDPNFRFAPWLFTITQSVLKDYFRKKKRHIEDSVGDTWGEIPAQEPESRERPNLEGLDERQRLAVEMRYEQDLSFDEIAKKLQTSSVNVRQLISRAIRKIRKEKSQEDL
jgi:RNA polymerase sigma factor (sigma-70 family)